MNSFRSRALLTFATVLAATLLAPAADSNWPQYRGPHGDGHSAEAGVPVHWDAHSVVWKVDLKGRGQSSPVIWGERIFLTSALDNGKQRLVFCLDRRDGKLLWERVVWEG